MILMLQTILPTQRFNYAGIRTAQLCLKWTIFARDTSGLNKKDFFLQSMNTGVDSRGFDLTALNSKLVSNPHSLKNKNSLKKQN